MEGTGKLFVRVGEVTKWRYIDPTNPTDPLCTVYVLYSLRDTLLPHLEMMLQDTNFLPLVFLFLGNARPFRICIEYRCTVNNIGRDTMSQQENQHRFLWREARYMLLFPRISSPVETNLHIAVLRL